MEEPFPDLSLPVQAEVEAPEEEQPNADLVANAVGDILNDPLDIGNAEVKEENLAVFQLDTADRDEVIGLLEDIDATNAESNNASIAVENVSVVQATTTPCAVSTGAGSSLLENVSAANAESNNALVTAGNLSAALAAITSTGVNVNPTECDDFDDDIIFDECEMPLPMASMRHGLVKHEDDDISGGLPFKTTVNHID